MRRTLHLLLVGVLTVWIPIDSAMAGWFLHHRASVHPGMPTPFPGMPGVDCPPAGFVGMVVIDDRPLNTPQWGRPLEVEIIHDAPQEWVVDRPHWTEPACCGEGEEVSVATETGWEENWSVESAPQDCACNTCGGELDSDEFPEDAGTEVTAPEMAEEPSVRTTLLPAPAGDAPTPTVAGTAAPLELPAQPTLTAAPVTDPPAPPLESVIRQPALPVSESTPKEPAIAAPTADVATPLEAPAAVNLFDTPETGETPQMAGDDLGPDAGDDLLPGDLPELVEEGVLEEFPAEPAPEDPAVPGDDQPAETPAASPESDPFGAILPTPAEPLRHWRDNTGRHDTLGTLVEVHSDRIRILKTNGRHATVSRRRLSTLDRDYVHGAAATAAAKRSLGAQTAGL